ncbi:hypothetical protein L226DRAFT_13321 [Lentinus tigrinus ALCF2SS1-7]|uniref:uncharacterized protein n=1 Tax=Lentinus tigrinus ALCF2SS1-7 TaxID=1328758 RepID=UPI0011662C1D|nr:hypothetical protein L226DRAFT_13321 [Lentinus tigrinus ALCF2SS1-7]
MSVSKVINTRPVTARLCGLVVLLAPSANMEEFLPDAAQMRRSHLVLAPSCTSPGALIVSPSHPAPQSTERRTRCLSLPSLSFPDATSPEACTA